MVIWMSLELRHGRVEEVERYHSLEDWIREVSLLAWEDPDIHAVDFVIGDQAGEVLATAMFGPELELFVTCTDGRRLVLEMPESYRG